MNKLQKAIIKYQGALLDLRDAEKARLEFERNYIVENNITNADGTHPECFPQIDCNATFMRIVSLWLNNGGELRHNEEYCNLVTAVADAKWAVTQTQWNLCRAYDDSLPKEQRHSAMVMYEQSHETRAQVIKLALEAA